MQIFQDLANRTVLALSQSYGEKTWSCFLGPCRRVSESRKCGAGHDEVKVQKQEESESYCYQRTWKAITEMNVIDGICIIICSATQKLKSTVECIKLIQGGG
jgi:hypothetical protein